jgi:hypothetical protein
VVKHPSAAPIYYKKPPNKESEKVAKFSHNYISVNKLELEINKLPPGGYAEAKQHDY